MRGLGSALVSLVDLDAGQAAADRQAEHLPVTLPGRERLRTGVALAELLGAERVQDAADNAEPAPRGLSGDWVRGFRRGAAQDRQSLRRCLPQHRLWQFRPPGARLRHSQARPPSKSAQRRVSIPRAVCPSGNTRRNEYNAEVKLCVSHLSILN